MPPLRGRGKKQAQPLREGDRGSCRPSGLISPFEAALDAMNELTETTMATDINAAQGHSRINRAPADTSASTARRSHPGKR